MNDDVINLVKEILKHGKESDLREIEVSAHPCKYDSPGRIEIKATYK